jgi:hypothetical protein
MIQKPFAAKNSDNGCLRGIEGIPSHKMMSFCRLLRRAGGKNSAMISFLNQVRNILLALSLMALRREPGQA